MFKRLAKFRLVQSWVRPWGVAQKAMPANDNVPAVLRSRGPRRNRSQALVCHWFLIDGGTRLGCRWLAEDLVQTELEDLDSGHVLKSGATSFPCVACLSLGDAIQQRPRRSLL
jgi:hypothetical protein